MFVISSILYHDFIYYSRYTHNFVPPHRFPVEHSRHRRLPTFLSMLFLRLLLILFFLPDLRPDLCRFWVQITQKVTRLHGVFNGQDDPHKTLGCSTVFTKESPPGLFHRHSGLQALACGKVSAGMQILVSGLSEQISQYLLSYHSSF